MKTTGFDPDVLKNVEVVLNLSKQEVRYLNRLCERYGVITYTQAIKAAIKEVVNSSNA